MRQTTLAVFAIVAIAVMMGAASVAPAYAAKKDFVESVHMTDSFPSNVCGVSVQVEKKVNGHFTIWDNGKFKFNTTTIKKFFDGDDNLVGHSSTATNMQGTFGDGPISSQDNGMVICLNGADNERTRDGFTIHRDGSVIVMNDHGNEPE